MSAKKWNFYYDKKEEESIVARVVDAISLWVAIGLLWLSFLHMLKEHFPLFLETITWVYDTDNFASPSLVEKTIGINWLVIVVFLLVLWIPTSGFLKGNAKRLSWMFSVAGGVIPVGYIVSNFDKVPDGIFSIAHQYLRLFNTYQGTSLMVPIGNAEYGPIVFTAVLMVLWLLIWGISCLLRRRIVLVLFPLCAVFLEFMVGLSPVGNGISFLFVAAFLLLIPNGTKAWKHAVVAAVAAISILISGVLFEEKIEKLSGDRLLVQNWIQNFQMPQWNLDKIFRFDFQINNESLDNHQPKYDGETVLSINANFNPITRIYLRGYCGTEYNNGNWNWNREVFKQNCVDIGYSEAEMAQLISSMPYEILKSAPITIGKENVYTITYVGTTGDTAYVPYVFDYTTLDQSYNFYGDFLIKKGVWDNRIVVTGATYGDIYDYALYTHYAKEQEHYRKMLWYNDIANQYVGSSGMKCIEDAAAEIKQKVKYPSQFDLMMSAVYVVYDDETLPYILENMYRMELAERVRLYLADMMSYSLILDKLPFGADPVEYALTVSHEGYCMHYASAATLILQEMGVPARYVSGYIARPSDFVVDMTSDTADAQISDYNSHAWVEIYLESFGWVPIEVTAGYESNTGDLPTQVDPQEWESQAESKRNEYESESLVPPTEGDTEEPTESESETEELPSESEKDSQSESESESEEGSSEGGSKETESENDDWRGDTPITGVHPLKKVVQFAMSLLVLAMVVVALVLIGRIWKYYYDQILENEISKKHTRRVVKRINKRIYRVLRFKMPFVERVYTDEKYEATLKQAYPLISAKGWSEYMRIVRKAHYSREAITEAEMMHCYEIYKLR